MNDGEDDEAFCLCGHGESLHLDDGPCLVSLDEVDDCYCSACRPDPDF